MILLFFLNIRHILPYFDGKEKSHTLLQFQTFPLNILFKNVRYRVVPSLICSGQKGNSVGASWRKAWDCTQTRLPVSFAYFIPKSMDAHAIVTFFLRSCFAPLLIFPHNRSLTSPSLEIFFDMKLLSRRLNPNELVKHHRLSKGNGCDVMWRNVVWQER